MSDEVKAKKKKIEKQEFCGCKITMKNAHSAALPESELAKFYENEGVSVDAIDKLRAADEKLITAGVALAGQMVIDDPSEKGLVKFGAGKSARSCEVLPTYNKPCGVVKKGAPRETVAVHGYVQLKIGIKTPKSEKFDAMVAANAAAIKKALKNAK